MAATKDDLRRWFQYGQESSSHMIILCDMLDWSDHPVYVESRERAAEYLAGNGLPNGYKVMEVYDLAMDMEAQMAEHRAWHI